MADYLRQIAAKALGRTPSVRPRVPSLFEPPPAAALMGIAAMPPAPDATPADATELLHIASAEAPAPQRPASPRIPVAPPVSRVVPSGDAALPAPPRLVAPPPVTAPLAAPLVGTAPVGTAPVGASPVQAAPLANAPVGATPLEAAPIGATPARGTPVRVTPAHAAPAHAAAGAAADAARSPDGGRDASLMPRTAVPLIVPAPSIARDRVHVLPAWVAPRAGAARAGATGADALADAPPTISVVIGHVSVQAVMPPAPLAPPVRERTETSAGPKMSLDQYLAERTQRGGRR